MMLKTYYPCLIFVSLLFLYGCDLTGNDENQIFDFLISEEYNRTITKEQLSLFWTIAGQPDANGYVLYDVDFYRITYHTVDSDGNRIEASGAIIVPVGIEHPRLLSVQHSTIFTNDNAPSVDAPGTISVATRKAIFASQGYVTFLPDYLGYGSTEDLLHPFMHKSTLASAGYDMIRAGMEFMEKKNIVPSDYSVNMIGYSEGAYATIALAELAESKNSIIETGFISVGGGIYDLSSTAKEIFENRDKPDECAVCYAYFIYSYHNMYDFTRPLSDYFQEPYAQIIMDGIFSGDFSEGEIRRNFPSNSADLFSESFLQRYKNGEETELEAALEENNLFYIPDSPLLLVHGIADGVAPVFNSDDFYDRAISAGKTNITYIRNKGVSHTSGIFDWAQETLERLMISEGSSFSMN